MFLPVSVTENLGRSFQYAKDTLCRTWIEYVIVFLCALIPIVNLLTLPGFVVRVFQNEFALGNWLMLVIDSVKALIITVVYLIIPTVISVVFGAVLGPYCYTCRFLCGLSDVCTAAHYCSSPICEGRVWRCVPDWQYFCKDQ